MYGKLKAVGGKLLSLIAPTVYAPAAGRPRQVRSHSSRWQGDYWATNRCGHGGQVTAC